MALTTKTPGIVQLLKFWGDITDAANSFAGQAGTFRILQTRGAIGQPTQPSVGIQTMNAVYGLAVANRTAAANLAAAQPFAAIGPEMIGETPNFRGEAAFAASPAYNVRTNYTYLDETTEPNEAWTTVQIPGALTTTNVSLLQTLVTTIETHLLTPTSTSPPTGKTLLSVTAVTINRY